MISVTDAEIIINKYSRNFETEFIDLSESLNRILAQDIDAQRNYPPFNRVAMDGICINYDDYEKGCRQFSIKGLQSAGSPPLDLTAENSCFEIMTGAMLSTGANTVVPYEQIEKKGDSFILQKEDLKKGANVHKMGKDLLVGAKLVDAYTKIEAHTIAILATEGLKKVPVYKLPSVVIISTGDELVPIEQTPKPFQIRTSNSYMLKAALKKLNIDASVQHINDDKGELKAKMSQIIELFDIILLSGGVSKGKLDFVPEILNELGVKKEFHRIAQRPGKPFWFGSKEDKLVFAFPGNPASSLLCFKKYFEPWLMLCLRQESNIIKVKLQNSFNFKPQLTYFAQAKLVSNKNEQIAQISTGNGSGDIANFALIDGFVELPAESEIHDSKDLYTFYKI